MENRFRQYRRWRICLGALLAAWLVAGCTGGTSTTVEKDSGPDGRVEDLSDEVLGEVGPEGRVEAEVSQDVPSQPETWEARSACEPGTGCLGETCATGADCLSGYCVEHLGNAVCTSDCIEECPPGWTCELVGGLGPDMVHVCISRFRMLCRPCATAADCASATGHEDRCLDYGAEGSFCGGSCDGDVPCPEGYECREVPDTQGTSSLQCVVVDGGTCECSQKSIDLGLSTPCIIQNELGACPGKRVCQADGLSGCDAKTPAAEECNGADDDCDGSVDEDTCDDGNPCTKDQCQGQAGCGHEPLSGTNCDDLDLCTLTDHCDDGVCLGTPVACDDGNPCTDDGCDGKNGCVFENNQAGCDDEDPCTLGDTCKGGKCAGIPVECDCLTDADCKPLEDGNACNGTLYCDTTGIQYLCKVAPETVAECPAPEGPHAACLEATCAPESGKCGVAPAKNGFGCNDGDECTVGELCSAGECGGGAPLSCDDGNPCTNDSCVPGVGCKFTPNQAKCDDGNACSSVDQCSSGVCTGVSWLDCSDGNACTDDSCVPGSGCVHASNVQPCDDGSQCTVNDACEAGQCKPGKAQSCDDANACTQDSCNALVGCVHVKLSGPCDDFDPCTIGDVCNGGICTGTQPLDCDDKNPCTSDTCIPLAGCSHDNNTLACTDGNPCTTNDKCGLGKCMPGAALVCNDGNVCTDDSCDPGSGCKFAPNEAACDDGNPCSSGDHCTAGKCQGTGGLDCDDGNPCTTDTCDLAGGCLNLPNTNPCDDGNLCTPKDVCKSATCIGSGTLACADGNPCTDDSCSPDKGCQFVPNQAQCDDGNACTLDDACTAGACKGGSALSCNDGNLCTTDSCDPAVGCLIVANNNPCTDGDVCTVDDACDKGVCKPGLPMPCDDGDFCNGTEVCLAKKGCQAGKPPTLDDGVACTVDACDSDLQVVTHTPNHTVCPAGGLCTQGACDTLKGCVVQTKPDCCGNLQVEAGEECDDGNTVGSDDCVDCKNAFCGDGVRRVLVEDCDGQDMGPGTCSSLLGAGFDGTVTCGAGCKYDTIKCKGPLGSASNPATSCKEILDAGKSTGNGVYYLKSGANTVKAWCDMSNGGWTLVTSWPHVPTGGVWGEFTTGLDDPAPGKKHAHAFRTMFPHPNEAKIVYLGNNQTISVTTAGGANWTVVDQGCRIQLSDGRYLVFERLHCQPGQGVCVHNGAYDTGVNCDGDMGQIAGQGMFNDCTKNEFCSCGTYGWKYQAGGCTPTVCQPPDQLAVYFR